MAQQAQIIFCIPSSAVVTITIAMAITVTVISTVVAKSVAVPATVTVVTIVGIGLSISISCGFSLSLAVGDSSIGVSRQTGGVVVASEARVHIVVVAQNETVWMVGSSVGTPLAVVEAVTKAEALGRPMTVGGGVASVVSEPVTEAMTIVAVVSIGIGVSAPLSTSPIESALEAEPDSGGPGGGDATGTNEGIAVGEQPVPVVAVVRVGISLGGGECKCHEAGDDLGEISSPYTPDIGITSLQRNIRQV